MKPGWAGAPVGSGSGVAPTDHSEPWPRVSMMKWAYPATAQFTRSWGRPRPPPYPTNSTTAGSGPVAPAGRCSQALTVVPPNPLKPTSNVSTSVSPVSTSTAVATRSVAWASARVRSQNGQRSSGTARSGVYARSSSIGRSNCGIGPLHHLVTTGIGGRDTARFWQVGQVAERPCRTDARPPTREERRSSPTAAL